MRPNFSYIIISVRSNKYQGPVRLHLAIIKSIDRDIHLLPKHTSVSQDYCFFYFSIVQYSRD
jgi:hypothetical protein